MKIDVSCEQRSAFVSWVVEMFAAKTSGVCTTTPLILHRRY